MSRKKGSEGIAGKGTGKEQIKPFQALQNVRFSAITHYEHNPGFRRDLLTQTGLEISFKREDRNGGGTNGECSEVFEEGWQN